MNGKTLRKVVLDFLKFSASSCGGLSSGTQDIAVVDEFRPAVFFDRKRKGFCDSDATDCNWKLYPPDIIEQFFRSGVKAPIWASASIFAGMLLTKLLKEVLIRSEHHHPTRH